MKTKLVFVLSALSALFSLSAHASSFSTVEFEEDYSLPIVYFSIIADVGSVSDPVDKLGLANLGARMMLRGTQTHTKSRFFEKINQLGGSIEVDVRDEGTVLRAAVLAENVDKFLELLAEAVTKPKFTADELMKLKKEIEGEILEQKGNDKVLVKYHFNRFMYGAHPYSHPVLGTQKGVKAINYKDIVNYYAQNYSGRTLRVFGTGAAKKAVVEKWFDDLSEKLTAIHPEAKGGLEIPMPVLPEGRRTLLVDKPKTTQTQVLLGGKGLRPETPGFYAVQLANHSFGGASFGARMMKEIRVKRGWTYGAYNTFRFGQKPRHFAMYVFPKTDDTPPAIKLELEMFQDFVDNGITAEEYKFARDSLVNNAPFNYDTPRKRLENATTEYLTGFPRGYHKDFADNIARVKHEDIGPSLKRVFNPSNLTLTVVGDAQKLKEPLSKLPGFTAPQVRNYLED